jgi:dTMP kinase
VVVTGVDRSGKETHCFNPKRRRGIVSLQSFLATRSYGVLGIRQPSYATPLGALVGAYLGGEARGTAIDGTLVKEWAWILWSLDRAQHNGRVLAWLAQSSRHLVLAKRWTESNVVYQQANGLDATRILHLERHIAKPDYTVILDVPVDIATQRLVRSGRPQDAYEQGPLLERVRRLYLSLPALVPSGETVLVNAARPPRAVNEDLRQVLTQMGF